MGEANQWLNVRDLRARKPAQWEKLGAAPIVGEAIHLPSCKEQVYIWG